MVALLPPLSGPLEPTAALRRIAFLLERTRAGSYRVEAFRKAAATIATLGPGELAQRHTAGTLQDLPGIGSSSAGVIGEALDGVVPSYLATLSAKAGLPLEEDGRELYAALAGDCHSHSNWSDGGSPIEEMVLAAVETGHDWLVLTDHSPQLRVANGLTAERLARQLALVDAINTSLGGSFQLLKGIEVDILDDGGLDEKPRCSTSSISSSRASTPSCG